MTILESKYKIGPLFTGINVVLDYVMFPLELQLFGEKTQFILT